jgi:hypothetical protein
LVYVVGGRPLFSLVLAAERRRVPPTAWSVALVDVAVSSVVSGVLLPPPDLTTRAPRLHLIAS